MTAQNEENQDHAGALTGRTERSYEVGYGKPPVHTRFKSGQSGNPKGRPKGSKNRKPAVTEDHLCNIVQAEARRNITISEGGQSVTLTMAEAITRRLAVDAAKGKSHARKQFLDLYAASEKRRTRLHEEMLELAIEYKLHWEQELTHRERTGATGEEPLPHPDHVLIDMHTGEVRIVGPVTTEQKKTWDEIASMKENYLEEVAWLRWRLDTGRDPDLHEVYQRELGHANRMLDISNRLLDGRDDEKIIRRRIAELEADPDAAH